MDSPWANIGERRQPEYYQQSLVLTFSEAIKRRVFVYSECMKFLCDEMLKGLARWLRAAGYDVVVEADGTEDTVLLERANIEDRILLTRDRRFAETLPDSDGVILLACNDQDDCFKEVSQKLAVNWLLKPFSRCLACNTLLIAGKAEQWDRVPEHSRQLASQLLYCPNCDQVFWDGSHVKQMRERLQRAAAESLQK